LYICDLPVVITSEAAALVIFLQAVLKIGIIYFQALTVAVLHSADTFLRIHVLFIGSRLAQ